jgi:hypothetical protein
MKTITFRIGEDQLCELRGGRLAMIQTNDGEAITMEWVRAASEDERAGRKGLPSRKTVLFGRIASLAVALVMMAGSAFAGGSFRVTYTERGLIQRITVQAESTADARRTVQNLFPGAVVTGSHRVK